MDGTAFYYAEASGSFTVTAVLTDTLARLADVTFPDTTSPGTGYALSGVTSATRSRVYTFIAASTFSGTTFLHRHSRHHHAAGVAGGPPPRLHHHHLPHLGC